MKKLLKNICTAVCCTAVAAVMTVSAAADISFDMSKWLLDQNDSKVSQSDDIFTVKGEVNYESDYAVSIEYVFEGDMTDIEFWNNEAGTVSCEVRLETEGVNVFAWIPAFGENWLWVDGENSINLNYNEWATVSTSMTHLYKGFKGRTPLKIMVQVKTHEKDAVFEEVQVSFRNFKINGVNAGEYAVTTTEAATTTPAATTTAATTTATEATTTTPAPEETTTEPEESEPEETEPEETEPEETEPEETEPEETEPEESEPEETEPEDTEPEETTSSAANAETTTEKPADTTIADNTTSAAQFTTASNIDYSQYTAKTDAGDAMTMVVVIAIIAGVIVLAAIIGFIIYKKMKFY